MDNDSNNCDHLEDQKKERDRRLRMLIDQYERNVMMANDDLEDEETSFNDDPIVDSDSDNSNNIGNETFGRSDEDESLCEILSQRQPRRAPVISESLSDSDLEIL